MADEPTKKMKALALNSKSSSKALKAKVIHSEEDASEEVPEDMSEDEEMVMMARRVSQWAKRSKRFSNKFGGSSKSYGSKDRKEDQNKCFKCNKSGHFIADCIDLNKDKSKKKSSSKEKYKNRVRKAFWLLGKIWTKTQILMRTRKQIWLL
jgi:hypothetical protein